MLLPPEYSQVVDGAGDFLFPEIIWSCFGADGGIR